MEKTDKPRICETLGGKDDPLEVGEQFGISTIPGVVFWICQDGTFDTCPGKVPKSAYHFLRAVEHPDRIIRKPRFTQEEVVVLRYIESVGVVSIERKSDTHIYWDAENMGGVMIVPPGFLPSLRPGQPVTLADIIHAT